VVYVNTEKVNVRRAVGILKKVGRSHAISEITELNYLKKIASISARLPTVFFMDANNSC